MSERDRIIRAIHRYARARAAADFTLADPSIGAEEFGRRVRAVAPAWEKLSLLVREALPATLSARDAFDATTELTQQLETYISNRRAHGHGPDAVADVLVALDALLQARPADVSACPTA